MKLKNYINEMNLLSKKIRNMEEISIPSAYQDWTTIHIDVMELFIKNLKVLKDL